jgi:formamidopyrimidine-DNA glycosylase
MPELPETEVVTREFRHCCQGAMLERIEILHPEIVDRLSDLKPDRYEKTCLQQIERHGKYILMTLVKDQEPRYIGIRLGMSGQLLRRKPGMPRLLHTHVILSLVDRQFEIHFRDPRRFGTLCLLSSPAPIQKGADALGIHLNTFIERLILRKGRAKAVLMNQSLIGGIGNIYANEILFESRIHPDQKMERLVRERVQDLLLGMKKVLRQAIRKGGTTIRDFRSLDEQPGNFQRFLKVYGKTGERCSRPDCPGHIRVMRATPQGQSSFYCPRCQQKT